MSTGETFPNLHGQIDVTGLAFHIYDAPSGFSVRSTFLCLIMEEKIEGPTLTDTRSQLVT